MLQRASERRLTCALVTPRRLVPLLVAVLSALTLAAAPALASGPAPPQPTARYEIDFLKDMIDHHEMAVHTATMCMEKAIHPELRHLCQQIVTTQTQEIQMMQSWLTSWYGVRHEPHMNAGHMREMERLASLEGAEFEVAFMEMMIRHHAMAVKEGERCVERAYHGELRQLCQDIISSQQAEIEMMQTWLCEWYGECKRQ